MLLEEAIADFLRECAPKTCHRNTSGKRKLSARGKQGAESKTIIIVAFSFSLALSHSYHHQKMPPWAANPTLARISYKSETGTLRNFDQGNGPNVGDFRVVTREAGSERQDLPIFTSAPGAIQLEKDDASSCRPKVTRTDYPKIPGCFVLNNVCTAWECEQIVKMAETMGWNEDAPVSLGRHVRQNENVVWIADPQLNDTLFERCKPLFPPDVNGGEVAGINMRWRLYKYQPEDIFRIHTDGGWPGSGVDPESGMLMPDIFNGDRFSQLTWVLYLNDEFDGGATRFFLPKEGVERGPKMTLDDFNVEEVPAKQGSAVCFFHGAHPLSHLHEGGYITTGTKYIIRSDVLYRRPTKAQRLAAKKAAEAAASKL